MKPKFRSLIAAFAPLSRSSLIVCASLCAVTSGHADQTWLGTTSTDWNTATNWNTTVPGAADIAIFDATSTLNLATTSSTSFSLKGVQVTSPTAAVSIALPQPASKVTNISLTVNFTTDVFTYAPASALVNGDVVTIGGTTAPTGVVGGLPYSVVNATATTFQISLTQGGTAVDFTAAGTAVTATGGTFNSLAMGTSGIDLSSATQNLTISAPITFSTAQAWNVNTGMTLNTTGVLYGAGAITKSGSGNLILSNGNNLSGGISVAGGQLTTKNGLGAGPATNTVTLNNGTTYRYERTAGNASTFQGFPITVPAASSVNITTDNGANGYSGIITGDSTSTVTIGSAASLTQCSFGNNANAQQFSGVGTVNIFAGASIRFSATSGVNNGGVNSTFDVGVASDITTRNSAVVNLGALTGVGTVTGSGGANGTAIFSVGAKGIASTYAGVIRDAAASRFAALTKVGAEKLTLTGANTYTGATNVNVGTLEIGNGGTTGSIGATNVGVAALANVVFNPGSAQTQTVSGIVSGAGNVLKQGTGRTNLNGVNTFTVGPVIEAGTLAINADTGLGNAANSVSFTTGAGTLASDAAAVTSARLISIGTGATGGFAGLDATDSIELTGVISGDGALAVSGSGLVRLTGANAYLGNTTVTSGTLDVGAVGATSSGSVSVTGGTLAGTGTVNGSVSVSSGAGLKPGGITTTSSSVGNLSTGQLDLTGGSTLYTEFTISSNDQAVVTGDLLTTGASVGTPVLVDLRLENSVAKWTGLGTFNLIQYSGTFSGNANDLFEVSPGSLQGGLAYTFGASGGFITLTISGAAPSEWNVDAGGTWSDTGNWLNGVPNAVGANAKFGTIITAPRTVTVDSSAKTIGAIQFNNANSYTLAGTFALNLSVDTANAGIEILSGNHEISAPLSLVDSVDLSFASAANTLTLSGNIGGGGGINNVTAGALVLSGTNTFGGNVNFTGGSLTFGAGSLGAGSLSLGNSTLLWGAGNAEDISTRTVTIGGTSVTLDTNSNDVSLAGAIGNGGAGAFVKGGLGKLTFASNPTFLGLTTISGGILQLGTGGTTGLVSGAITNNAGLDVNLTTGSTFSNLVTGTGTFAHTGTGSLTLAAQNTFSGTSSISSSSGTLILSDALNLQNSTLNLDAAGGSLNFGALVAATLGGLSGDKGLVLDNITPAAVVLSIGNNGQNTTYTGVLSGTGSLTKLGAGISSLGGVNTYAGATLVTTGNLELVTGGSIGSVTPSTLTVNGTGKVVITGGGLAATTGTLAVGSNGFELTGGTVTFSGTLSAVGGTGGPASALIRVNDGTLTVPSIALGRTGESVTTDPVAATADRNLYLTGGTVNVTGNLDVGTASAQPNSTVVTRIDGGTLNVGGALTVGLTNTGRWSMVDVNGGNLVSTNAISGIMLGGTFVGVTAGTDGGRAALLVRAGTATTERIQIGQAGLNGAGLVRVMGGALYVGSGGIVSGTVGAFYTSEIRLSGGALAAKANWSSAHPVNIAAADNVTIKAANAADAPFDIILSGLLSGSTLGVDGLIKDGGGTLTLSGGHPFSGNTTISKGTLSVTTKTFNDTSKISIDTVAGGKLNLGFSGGDKVTELVIDGVTQVTGTWGATGSGATNINDSAFSGSGILYVGVDVVLTAYEIWAQGAGLTFANDGPTQDPDFDGIANSLEFVLGGNPLASSTGVLPTLDTSGSNFVFAFNRQDISIGQVALTFQHGSDLSGWTDIAIPENSAGSVTVTPGAPADAISVSIPKGANTLLFGRLKAVK